MRAAEQASASLADLIEWRIDFLDDLCPDTVVPLAGELSQILNSKPLLITFRNLSEGGHQRLSDAAYCQLYEKLIDQASIALIDVEYARPSTVRNTLIDCAHHAGVRVVLSAHHFKHTPQQTEIVSALKRMADDQADIAKIAVMPQTPSDVLALMQATLEASEHVPIPIVTMAMGQLGKISRISGSLTGSAITFGSLGASSAPGQMQLDLLKQFVTELSN